MIASGKDTQANKLKRKYALKFIETGTYSRRLLKEKSKDGDLARQTTGKGLPLHTKLIQRFLIEEIKNKPKNKDLLFLGGRLKPEAQLIKKIMRANNEKFLVFYLSIPDKEVYKRSLDRQKSNIKQLYKILDTKNLIAKRIKWHKEQVGKTVNYYQKLGLVRIINANQPIEKVSNLIEKEIEKFKSSN